MKKSLATLLMATMLSVLMAGAPASAHQRTASTSLSISVSDTRPDRGDVVTFSGRLSSNWDRCEEDQKVHLKRGGNVIQTTRTSDSGFYSFRQRINGNSNWVVRFTGKRFGVHPHVHRCLPDTSRKIKIRFGGGDN